MNPTVVTKFGFYLLRLLALIGILAHMLGSRSVSDVELEGFLVITVIGLATDHIINSLRQDRA